MAEDRTETVGDWLGLVHDLYPPAQAHDWDHVGLQVGAADWPVARVLVTLDVTTAVVAEAAEAPDTLVLAHHPLLFRPLARLTPDTAPGRIALAAARAGVAVAAAHTNLDVTGDGAGTSDPVARALGLVDPVPITTDLREHDQLKLVVFVPTGDTERVLDALAAAGAGGVGDYERCSFRVTGTGTFRPGPGTDPHLGTVGEDAAVTEDRLEVEVPRRRVGAVVAALLAAHPYEEVAYDLYPRTTGATVGLGRVGDLPQPMPLRAVAARVRDALPAPHTRVAGTPDRLVRRVAVVGGSGMSMVGAARAAGADVLVTGDAKHHEVLDALELGLAVVDAGHHATEAAALPAWVDRLTAGAQARGLTAPLVRSQVSTVPWSA